MKTVNPAQHGPQFGLVVTLAGAMMFVPDALLIRLIGGSTMDVAIWRALFACVTTSLGIALFARHTIPTWAELLTLPTLIFVVLHGTGSLLFLGALGHTSVANTLLISATAPSSRR